MRKKDLASALELGVGLNRRESKDFVEAFIDEGMKLDAIARPAVARH